MNGPTLRGVKAYAQRRLGLERYLRGACGDGRRNARKPARDLLWAMLAGQCVRENSYCGVESLVRSTARRNLGVNTRFGDDALAYFTERLDPGPTRAALVETLHRAKRNKAFAAAPRIGLALDGTTVGRCASRACQWCRTVRNQEGEVTGYRHHVAMISVVGGDLVLPFDVEPYGPGDSEPGAVRRLLARAAAALGARFADYVVVDAGLATSAVLHGADAAGLPIVARLKNNLHELSAAAEKRFAGRPPDRVVTEDGDRVELWDAADFDPWETLRWKTVRVLRYRQHKPDGTIVEAQWLTNLTPRQAPTIAVYHMAKSRWQIENEGFNDCKSRQGLEHMCHHHANSLLIGWLLTLLALVIVRLYRLRHLHRGSHPLRTAIELVRLLRIALGSYQHHNTG